MTSEKRDPVRQLLEAMREQGLQAQLGGFSVEAIPTGISAFDVSTGIGGFPLERISLVVGEEGSGKTLLLLALIAELQRAGGRAAFVDAEHALTPGFATLLGVDYDNLVIARPRTLNESYDLLRAFCSSGLFGVVGFDSATALTTIENLQAAADSGGQRAAEAQIHSAELKKLIGVIASNCALVMIGQMREDPNPPLWYRRKGVKKLYMPGGRAIRHHSSMIVTLKAKGVHKDSAGSRVGHCIVTDITKNKVAVPFKKAQFDLRYATGLDYESNAIESALSTGIIVKNGSWFSFEVIEAETGEVIEELKWLGRDKMDKAFRASSDLFENLRLQIGIDHPPDDDVLGEPTRSAWDEVG